MRITRFKPTHLSNRVKLLIASGVVIAGTSGVAAFNTLQPTSAEETPIKVVVEDHNKRLDKAEADIADTNSRVDQVEQQTEANTQAIGTTQQRVTVVERKVETQPAPQQAPAASTPSPEPRKTNPRLVTQVVRQEEKFDRFGTHVGWSCEYVLGDDINRVRRINNISPEPCYGVGDVISDELATVWGVK
ncbi:hypothetical protein [Mycobacteroides abscessus]|uniref:hypothetical protein n=1 Tax=Mycobacteroides abscessus TaxID=36809 RepID=UPI000C25DF8B|nr:hypothetical protein [Mycobacteroides abscessus]